MTSRASAVVCVVSAAVAVGAITTVVAAQGAPRSAAPPATWHLVLRATIARDTASPLRDPAELVVDSRGRTIVLDRQPAAIRVFDRSGRELPPWAREGGGPGEIADAGMLLISRDTVVHQDPRQSRAQAFTPEGRVFRQWRSPCCMRVPVAADTLGRYPLPGVAVPAGGAQGMTADRGFARFQTDGRVTDTIAFWPMSPPKLWQVGGDRLLIPFQPTTLGVFSRGGLLLWGNQGVDRLVVSRHGRDTVRLISVPGARPVPISPALRAETFAQLMKRRPELASVARLSDLPSNYPSWSGMAIDDADRIWLLRPGVGGVGHFDVLALDGVVVATVPTTLSDATRLYITRGSVYAIESDEMLGSDVIRVFDIVRR